MPWQTIGFDRIKFFFEKVLTTGDLSHAYIFSGQEMIGKKTFAVELASITSEIDVGKFNPNLMVVDSSGSESGGSIVIDDIRKVRNFCMLTPYSGSKKAVIIDGAHQMTPEAQNALLKILEEPSDSSILILVSSAPQLLLPTVISRCQEIKFYPQTDEMISRIFQSTALPKNKADFFKQFCAGRIGLAKKIISENSLDKIEKQIKEFMEIVKSDINSRLMAAQQLAEGKNKQMLSERVLYWILYARMRLDQPRAQKVLKGLLRLNQIVSQPQFNVRLALENFFVLL